MAIGLRFRAEAARATSTGLITGTPVISFPAGTTVLVPATAIVGVQRPGIYRALLSGNASAAATFQFQDTGGNAISAVYAIATSQFILLDTPINGDPWWQATAAGLGLQIVVTSATITGDIYWASGA